MHNLIKTIIERHSSNSNSNKGKMSNFDKGKEHILKKKKQLQESKEEIDV